MLSATSIEFMLPTLAPPFSRQGWWFEMKYDGYRVLCEKTRAGVLVLSRRKYNATGWFPEVVDVLAGLPGHFILDAEACVVDKRGVPHFERLRKRAALKGWKRGADLVQLFAFDLLVLGNKDLRPLPLESRKAQLRKLIPASAPTIGYIDGMAERGLELFAAAVEMGMEGVVAKRLGSPYAAGRSRDWIKSKPKGFHEGWDRPLKSKV